MQSLQTIKQLGVVRWYRVNLGTVYESVYRAYKMRNQTDSLLKYQELTLLVKDSLYRSRIKNLTAFQAVTLNEQLRFTERGKKIRSVTRTASGPGYSWKYRRIAAACIHFYRNNRQKQKANNRLEKH